MMEIIFLRAHNNIAAALLKNNQEWDDEKTFQEARRLLNAFYKQILYSEVIPTYIGKRLFFSSYFIPVPKDS